MIKCSPIESRKNLIAANMLIKAGVDFVCVPVSSAACKNELLNQSNEALELLVKESEVSKNA